MKREILFRGKSIEDGAWCYGFLYIDERNSKNWILTSKNTNADMHMDEVDPESVGQLTGFKLPDKEGKKIKVFDGDIIEFDRIEWGSSKDVFFLVLWNAEDGEWSFGGGVTKGDMEFRTLVGNRFDNPELLKK